MSGAAWIQIPVQARLGLKYNFGIIPCMDERIARVLDRLGRESQEEKSRKRSVSPGDRMLAITEDTGRFLNMLLYGNGFANVLEVGTSAGYSTIWMAEAVYRNGGRVTTIEHNPSKAQRARKNFEEAGISNVEVLVGGAPDVLRQLKGMFDFAFIDADKENVVEYFDRALDLIRPGGMILVDNMLYPKKYRGTMDDLRRHIRSKGGVRTVTVPIGNGEELTLKV